MKIAIHIKEDHSLYGHIWKVKIEPRDNLILYSVSPITSKNDYDFYSFETSSTAYTSEQLQYLLTTNIHKDFESLVVLNSIQFLN